MSKRSHEQKALELRVAIEGLERARATSWGAYKTNDIDAKIAELNQELKRLER